jgi:iron complex transport system substrate-binding protein
VIAALAGLLAPAAGAAVRVTDDAGVVLELPMPARRIVSLAPHATELLFAAGAGPEVVAVLKGSDAPAAAKVLPIIGDVNGLDIERILAFRPDLVVTWPYTTPGQVAILRERGIAVFTTDAHSVPDIARDLEALGVLAGTSATADVVAARMRSRAAALARQYSGKAPVRVFYQVSGTPIFTIGAGHIIERALAGCGGVNVFADAHLPAPQVDVEAVLARKPDLIVAATAAAVKPDWLDAWKAWPQLPAVARDNLATVDADRLHRAGPRFVDGMEQLCQAVDRARRP